MSDDLVALTSDIGTWTAAFLAIVALTGIIGPWLAIRAASSDKNRAFNAIYDKDKVYVKFRGIPIGSRLRVFRRIRVPDLAPNYKSNKSETLSLLPSADQLSKVDTRYITSTDERIIFRPQSYSRFNKGWSKLCTTLDSYEVDAARFKIPESGGMLEVVNKGTALVVSRSWILILGLLGRYSDQPVRRTHDPTAIQRDLKGSQHSVRGSDTDSELDYGSDPDYFSDSYHPTLNRYQNHSPTLNRYQNHVHHISGITGVFRLLRERSGSRLNLSTVKFRAHHKKAIIRTENGANGHPDSLITSSVAKQFWLASGIIPMGDDAMFSIEDPVADGIKNNLLRSQVANNPPIRYFKLKKIDTVPALIKTSMVSLGIRNTPIQRFQEDSRDPPQSTIVRRRPRSDDDGIQIEPTLRPSEDKTRWVSLTDHHELKYMKFWKEDVEKIVFAFLSLQWDACGHLVWEADCLFWTHLLQGALIAFGDDSNISHVIRNHLKVHILNDDSMDVFDWDLSADNYYTQFNPTKTHHLVDFASRMLSDLSSDHVRHLGVIVGTLFIVDPSLIAYVLVLCLDEWLLLQVKNEVEVGTPEGASINTTQTENEPEYVTPEEGASTNTTQTENEPEYVTPEERDSPETVHANTQPRFLTHPDFQYNIADRILTNRPDNIPDTSLELKQWHCSTIPPFSSNPGTQVVTIPAKDMVRIALWTAARAALWLNSLNSRPLLSFCNKLSRDVYVL